MPTILFTPHFSGTAEFAPAGTTISQDHANSLSSPSVVLIFSGSYWTTTNGSYDRQSLTTAVQGIMCSGYLGALNQYGSDGKAVYYGSFQDNTTPTLTVGAPTAADLQSYVQSEVKSHPGSVPGGANVLYMVVNDPKDSYSSRSTYGFNSWRGDGLHTAYVGAVNTSTGILDQDGFTQVFSHELAEAMAPSVHVSDPGNLNLGYQIADGEPESFGQGYTYRLRSGDLVQAYWSQRDGAWVVPDGSSQKFTLTWATASFNNTYNLQVMGDQLGVNYSDDITVDYSSNTSGTEVIENGESVSFAPGAIKTLNIDAAGGSNTVKVKNVEAGETVNVNNAYSTSFDMVVVGWNHSVVGIQGTVNVSNSSGQSWLQIDDSNNAPRNMTITYNTVAFQGLGAISYGNGVRGVEIDDAYGANQINAQSVSASAPVLIVGNSLDNLFGPAANSVRLNRLR